MCVLTISETVFRPNPAGPSTIGENEMLRRKFMYKRSVMIAVAVIALMTLTAGVAAAASNSTKFTAKGEVLGVGLPVGGTVKSDFSYKSNGKIKSVVINTAGEQVGGAIFSVKCSEHGKKGGEACTALKGILAPSGVLSVHSSTATLKVKKQPHPYEVSFQAEPVEVISGSLKGELDANLGIGGNGENFGGAVHLKIKGRKHTSYGCLLGLAPSGQPAPNHLFPVFGVIAQCEGVSGLELPVVDWTGIASASPVLVPLELHVTDTGKFTVYGDAGTVISGNLKVTVDSDPNTGTSGKIQIKKGKATFPPAP